MARFTCPRCGADEPPVRTIERPGHAAPDYVFCAVCKEEIPCPTCYGAAHQDYIACWTCGRCPSEEPCLTDDADLATALQNLVRSYYHDRP